MKMGLFQVRMVRGRARRVAIASLAGGVFTASLVGCGSGRVDRRVEDAFESGQYGVARVRLQEDLTDDRADRAYILDRMRLEIACLADGDPWSAEIPANDAFSILRVQGLNDDRTTSAVVFNEGVKIWKGEPFEQALSYCYIALQKGMLGEWDNARAAASGSLFLLRDFGENEKGEELSTLEIAQNTQRQGDDYLDKGYAAVKTDFALGYLINGVANKAIGRDDEANDNFAEAARVNAGLEGLRDTLIEGKYNTVFVVDYGRGPQKVGYGPDGALARFSPREGSDQRGLSVTISSGGDSLSSSVAGSTYGSTASTTGVGTASTASSGDGSIESFSGGGSSVNAIDGLAIDTTSASPTNPYTPPTLVGTFPSACDVNQMATAHMWNNLEDVRIAKSTLGQGLIFGGAIAAGTAGRNNDTQALIGLGAIAAGILMRANAGADTRHLEFLPQRVYIAPVMVEHAGTTVTLEVGGDPMSRVVLPGLSPPVGNAMQLRYVRVPNRAQPTWLASGMVVYANDQYPGRVPGDELPYILGGRCMRKPSRETLTKYQAAGHLTNFTTIELENLYREEGITFTSEDQMGRSVLHVLEGGTSMIEPLAGTAGYARLFCQEHRAYVGKSQMWKDLKKAMGTRD